MDRQTYRAAIAANGGSLDPITWRLLPRISEVADELQPHQQRTVFEVSPELSFYQLNDDRPLRHPKGSRPGVDERIKLLSNRIQKVEPILETRVAGARLTHVLDACAALWTARRSAARAVARLPLDPEWNSEGLRMEIVR